MKKDMRIAALPLALLSIGVGIAGIASPEGGMTLRRLCFVTPSLFYAIATVRSAMGFGLILAASSSRWPRTLRALGAVVCLQGLSAGLLGLDHARAIMEWEGRQGSAILRAGAAMALASGAFIVFAVTVTRHSNRGLSGLSAVSSIEIADSENHTVAKSRTEKTDL